MSRQTLTMRERTLEETMQEELESCIHALDELRVLLEDLGDEESELSLIGKLQQAEFIEAEADCIACAAQAMQGKLSLELCRIADGDSAKTERRMA